MKMNIIAVDMDGTFLRHDNTYDKERFEKQYQQLKQQGCHFVVASGNQYYQLRSFFPEIQNEITFIAENGAFIVDQGQEVFVAKLSPIDVQAVIRAINKYPSIKKIVCGKKSAYIHESVDQEYYDRLHFYYPRLEKVAHFEHFDDTIFKVFLSCNEDNFDTILEELTKDIGHIMTPVDCGHFGIDLIIPGINKAHGIELLLDRWNCQERTVAAFGDSGNDAEMLQHATYSFAMANGKQQIKDLAKYTIASNDEDGVLDAIDWMLEDKEMFNK